MWSLIDDVLTVGTSLKEAIKIVGRYPSNILVAVDRRIKNENPIVSSIFQI